MGTNYHNAWTTNTRLRASEMTPPLSQLDRAITYCKPALVHCDGVVSYNKLTGSLSWSDVLRILFIREDGQSIQNTVNAGSIALADNQFAYVDLNETNNTVLSVAVAAVTTGSASNFSAANRLVLGYRNTASDQFYPVNLSAGMSTGHVIQENGTNREQRAKLNFKGYVTVSDDSGNDATVVNIPNSVTVFAGNGPVRGALIVSNATQAISASTHTAIAFGSAVRDSDSFFNIATPSRITIPAGVRKVKLSGNITTATASTSIYTQLRIYKNGSSTGDGLGINNTAGGNPICRQVQSAIIDVSPGDYFELFIWSSSAVTIQTSIKAWFQVEVVEGDILFNTDESFTSSKTIDFNTCTEMVSITLTDAMTLNAQNGFDGRQVIFRLKQDGVGNRVITWGSMFRFSTTVPEPTLSTAANAIDYITFRYNSADNKYDCMSVNKGF